MAKKTATFTVTSVQYVHDPTAAKAWFDETVELFKEELLKRAAHKDNNREGDGI